MAVRLSALRADRPLHPPGRFLVLISVRGWSTPGHSAAWMIRLFEKSNDLIGNQTRDFSACSVVHARYRVPPYLPIRYTIESCSEIHGNFSITFRDNELFNTDIDNWIDKRSSWIWFTRRASMVPK
jgi:hypothetical protein